MIETIKLRRGSELVALVVSPWAKFAAHWWNGRSYFCPVRDCPLCEAWPPRLRRAAIVKIGGRPEALLELPNGEIGECGDVIQVLRTKRQVNVTVHSHLSMKDERLRPIEDAWQVVAQLLELPWPEDGKFNTDVMKRWSKMAHRRLTLAINGGAK